MLSPFICGSGNFNHQEAEDDRDSLSSNSPCTTPRKSRKSNNKDSKNPYSNRGLDKFSALLAELEEKRQKIYSQVDPQDISFVRFVYSPSNEVVPIIVKQKDEKKITKSKSNNHKTEKPRNSNSSDSSDNCPVDKEVRPVDTKNQELIKEEDKKTEKKKKVTWNLKIHKWRRPSYYMPVFVILILTFLAFFGRSVAILCTSIGWYIIPTLSSSSLSKPVKKKQMVRKFSELSYLRIKNNIDQHAKVKSSTMTSRQNSF